MRSFKTQPSLDLWDFEETVLLGYVFLAESGELVGERFLLDLDSVRSECFGPPGKSTARQDRDAWRRKETVVHGGMVGWLPHGTAKGLIAGSSTEVLGEGEIGHL